MLIEDHSITYINLQDKSGIKFDSNNNVIEIINYRNKYFEYKINNSINNIKYLVDNINPNESHYILIFLRYFKSNIIEDYRITLFIVIKENNDNIFNLNNNDETLQLLHASLFNNKTDNKKLDLTFTTKDIHTNIRLETNMLYAEKNLICISWNGVNSAAYTNGKKIYTFNHSGVGSSASGNHILHTPDDGKLYEFIIFNSLNLNDEKINSINRYLADKHDITLSV